MASIDNITQASHPLIGETSLAARPHGDQAVPPDIVPPFSPHVAPPLAPASVAELDYRREQIRGEPELRYRAGKEIEIKYKDGTTI